MQRTHHELEDSQTLNVPKRGKLDKSYNGAPGPYHATTSTQFSHSDYTVGWICALPLEMAAAKAMLDEVHAALPNYPQDHNTYTLGQMGVHNIVIACVPSGVYGTTSAVTVATLMQSSFKSIRIGLMVGIGGGAPSPRADIRLGDIVADHIMRPSRIPEYLSELAVNYPSMVPKFTHCGRRPDQLFDAQYEHLGSEDTCEGCDPSKLVTRPPRPGNHPVIHYGLIASGNQVMRHGRTRDRWARELGILCFEMEAAGLMDHFPCLVIRGICDYADSHKNKKWQEYAAATAAAYAKELLYVMSGDQVDKTQASPEATSPTEAASPDDPSRFLALSKRSEWTIAHEGLPSYNIFEHLSDYKPDRTYKNFVRNRCPKTTGWILEDKRFVAWLEGRSHPCLWLSGKIGCGKTLVTSTVLQRLVQQSQKTGRLVVHFFYSRSNKSRLEASDLFRSYVKQMIGYLEMTRKQCPLRVIDNVKRFYGPKGDYPNFEEIIDEIFEPLRMLLPCATYVVDGLDECELDEVRKVLKTFRKMMSQQAPKIFISGREVLDIKNSIQGSAAVVILGEDTRDDIRRFIEWRIEEKMRERQLTEKESVLQDIKNKLNEKADRMILWVNLQLEVLWDDCYTDADIQSALASLPKDLNETYNRCLSRISRNQSRFAQKILPWVCAAINPFKASQLIEALSIDPVTGCINQDNMPSTQEVLKCCSNLILRDGNDQILLAHYSVRQFLEDRTADAGLFPTGLKVDVAELELGSLCVTHLSSTDYSRALHSYEKQQSPLDVSRVVGTVINSLGVNIPYLGRPGLVKPRPVHITPQTLKGPAVKELPSFFYFAKQQWAPLTHKISKSSNHWHKFKTLALEPNISWRLHPWEPLGDSLDSHFSALLGWAIVNRHLPLLDVLFDSQNPMPRADIFNLPFYRYSNLPPLHLASRIGQVESTQRLLQVCNPKKMDDNDRIALHHAAETGHTEVARLLLKKKGDLKAKDNKGQTPLHLAAGNGHEKTTQDLVNLGANVNAKDAVGRTALFTAAGNGHEAIVRVLVEHGASVNEKDNKKWMPLFIAADNEHEAIVRTLIEQGADVKAQDSTGRTALYIAAVRVLAQLGPDVNSRGDVERIALFMATQKGHEARVRMLVHLGADINEKDDDGRTLLSYTAGNGHEALVRLLLKKDADPESKDREGRTPLSWAAVNGHEAVARLLLEKGADPESMDRWEWTPLSRAARNGREAVARLLLEKGADPKTRDPWGGTPLSWATQNGHEVVARLLQPYYHTS